MPKKMILSSISCVPGPPGITSYPESEMHLVTAGEVTAGYFSIGHTPESVKCVDVFKVGGIRQINKQNIGATGETPDYDVLSSTEIHINDNGAATGLSGLIVENDVVIIDYRYL